MWVRTRLNRFFVAMADMKIMQLILFQHTSEELILMTWAYICPELWGLSRLWVHCEAAKSFYLFLAQSKQKPIVSMLS